MTTSPVSGDAMELVDDEAWLIVKRDLYYRPNGQGYTGIRDLAGRYSYEEAMAHHSPFAGETIVKLTEAPEFSKECFNDLALDHLRKQRNEARAEIERLRSQGGAPEGFRERMFSLELISSGEGQFCISLDDYRICGPKLSPRASLVEKWSVRGKDLAEALGLSSAPQPPVQPPEGGTGWRTISVPADRIVACQKAFTRDDHAEAYHQLRMMVDPDCEVYRRTGDHWSDVEAIAAGNHYITVKTGGTAALPRKDVEGAAPEWTEGACGDGAAILRDGQPVPISELLRFLNAAAIRDLGKQGGA